jgi:hypothetical protein
MSFKTLDTTSILGAKVAPDNKYIAIQRSPTEIVRPSLPFPSYAPRLDDVVHVHAMSKSHFSAFRLCVCSTSSRWT